MTDSPRNDYGPAERAQHDPMVKEALDHGQGTRMRVWDTIEVWREAGDIDSAMATAADSYLRDFRDAGMDISCEHKEKVDGAPGTGMTMRADYAQRNLNAINNEIARQAPNSKLAYWRQFCLREVVGMGRSAVEVSRLSITNWRAPRSDKTIKNQTIAALEVAAKVYRLA